MQTFYSNNLTFAHGYIKVNIRSDDLLDSALSHFNEELQKLLSKNGGKVMHTKTFQQSLANGRKRVQIRCYFAYSKAPFKSKEEWVHFID